MNEQVVALLQNPLLMRIGILLLLGIGLMVIVRVVRASLLHRISGTDSRYRARKVTDFIAYLIFILLILVVFGQQLQGLSVTIGLAGAGVAFALQEVIASIAGWFAITFAHFFKPGDRVQLAGIKGDVIDVGVLRTTIMELGDWVDGDLYNGRVVRITNSYVFKAPVFNYSAEFPFLWDEITIPIRFGSDYAAARSIMENVLQEIVGEYSEFAKRAWQEMIAKFLIEQARIEPMISMVADENWVTFTLRYVVDFKARRRTKDLIYTQLIERIEKANDVALASSSLVISVDGEPEKQPPH
ncbi:mechanosensitive ion channel family protein [bacterium]|nr:mechanosensitive ion channel family protein [bacterium]